MARYRKVETRIWNDEAFMSMSDDGQLAFLFLLTHPNMTSLGAMRATVAGLASEKRWQPSRMRRAIFESEQREMVELDETVSFIALPNFLRYNPPENPNVVKSWGAALERIPECMGRDGLLQRMKELSEGLSEAFKKALPQVLAHRFGIPGTRNQEPGAKNQEPGVGARAREARPIQWPIPDALATPEFLTVWQEFRDYRAYDNHHPMSETAERQTLAKLLTFGPSTAAEALRESMANDYRGVFPEKVMNGARRGHQLNTSMPYHRKVE